MLYAQCFCGTCKFGDDLVFYVKIRMQQGQTPHRLICHCFCTMKDKLFNNKIENYQNIRPVVHVSVSVIGEIFILHNASCIALFHRWIFGGHGKFFSFESSKSFTSQLNQKVFRLH